MAQQTAVEWLFDQLKERGYVFTYAGEFPPHLLFEQAKQMEKEQIMKAAKVILFASTGPGDTAAEQYYNETYKK
jgi:hypothetical protein